MLDDTTAQIHVLAAGQIDADLGMVNQDGDSYFETFIALKSYAGNYTPGVAMRFSLQHQNPLVSGKVTGGSGYDAKQFSLINISDSQVVTWAVKPAEEGIEKGMILRVWNVSDVDKPVTIKTGQALRKAYGITHIETDDREIPVNGGVLQTSIGHNKMETFRLY